MKRQFKKTVGAAAMTLLFSILLPITPRAQTQTREQLVISLSKPDKPFKLTLGLGNGSITVEGYGGKNILIDAEPEGLPGKTEKGKTGPHQNTNTNINVNTNVNIHKGENKDGNRNGGKYLVSKENNNVITVSPVAANKGLHVVIKVPGNPATLHLSIADKGDISITNVSGEMEITGNTGSVSLENISGSAVVNTVTGNIIASFKKTDPMAMAFSTLIGSIDLTFPDLFKADVKLKSDNGEIFTDFVIEPDEKQNGAHPRPLPNPNSAANTKYRMNNADWVYGMINRGGPGLMMKTTEGNIYIRKTSPPR